MTEKNTASPATAGQTGPLVPFRPKAWITKIGFNDGTELTLRQHEIVVFVGPNNAGKSAALRDIDQLLTDTNHRGLVVTSMAVQVEGSQEEFAAWADKLQKPGSAEIVLPFGLQNRGNAGTWWNRATNGAGLDGLKPLFAIHLSTESRLRAANDIASINFTADPLTHPLHHLYDQDELENRLSRMFRQAFGVDLIVNRGAGANITLHLGQRPIPAGGDRVAKTYRDAVNALPKIQLQGDGIRAFVGVLLHTLVIDHNIILIDEPDAFLHPPQAVTLGRLLTIETPKPRQLMASTHSSDFLRGTLDAPDSIVRVVRVRRNGDTNRIRELSPENVRKFWRDPLLRHSNILDGLFHDGVIVCEADSDCRFYGAMMDAVTGSDLKRDLLLVHGGGKARVPTIADALRAIDVPVRTVLDFDALRDEAELKKIYEAFGGVWAEIETDIRIVQAAIQAKRAELSTDEVRARIEAALAKANQNTLPRETAKEINDAVRYASPWAEAKRIGKAFIPNGEASQAYVRLSNNLRAKGVYVVEVGELEQFCKSVPAHGPSWVMSVLERDLSVDAELETARQFARSLLADW